MLKINKIPEAGQKDEIYICNYCGRAFNIRDALLNKGNIYLCSMKCVLAYEEASHSPTGRRR